MFYNHIVVVNCSGMLCCTMFCGRSSLSCFCLHVPETVLWGTFILLTLHKSLNNISREKSFFSVFVSVKWATSPVQTRVRLPGSLLFPTTPLCSSRPRLQIKPFSYFLSEEIILNFCQLVFTAEPWTPRVASHDQTFSHLSLFNGLNRN